MSFIVNIAPLIATKKAPFSAKDVGSVSKDVGSVGRGTGACAHPKVLWLYDGSIYVWEEKSWGGLPNTKPFVY